LSEYASKQLLEAYGIPTVDTYIAVTEDEAVTEADRVGYPVVLKLYSDTITHKTDVGGVRLLLQDAETVRKAYHAIKSSVTEKVGAEHFLGVTVQPMLQLEGYELIIGSSLDPQFGPILLFGTGGSLVEVFRDHALALPPLNTTLARRLLEQTTIYTALQGVRGQKSVDLAALEHIIVRFSQLVVEQPQIKEIEINPLLVSSEHLIALDARVVLHDSSLPLEALPTPAVRPYPIQYIEDWTLNDGRYVTLRPIRPEDEGLVVKFHETLSEESVYLRYFHLMKLQRRVAHERLTRICFIDYDREMALVADHKCPETGEHEILGIGRLSKLHGQDEAEFALLVSDRAQRQGLGTKILQRLCEIGQEENLHCIHAEILPENYAMQTICTRLGFKLQKVMAAGVVKATLRLTENLVLNNGV
jgi:acetyltransferase